MDSETRHFMPRQPQQGERLLLVDATVQTGCHLQGAEEQVLAAGASVCGAVVIAMNDMLPLEAKPDNVAHWLKADRLIYFYRLSDLYRHWRVGQRTSQEMIA